MIENGWFASAKWSGPLCAFFASVTWAYGSARYSQLAKQFSPFAVNFARALFALPLFIGVVFVSRGGVAEGLNSFGEISGKHWLWFGLSMLTSYGIADVLFLLSTQSLGISGGLAIASTYPIWTALAGIIWEHQFLMPFQTLGLGLAVGGVVLVVMTAPQGLRNGGNGTSGKRIQGVILAVITSLLWAVNSFAVGRGGRDLDVALGNVLRMSMAMGMSLVVSKTVNPARPILLPRSAVVRSAGLFAIEAFGGSYLFVYGLSHSSLAIGATLSSLAPVLSVPLAIFMGFEKFSSGRTGGIFLVVLGICLLINGDAS